MVRLLTDPHPLAGGRLGVLTLAACAAAYAAFHAIRDGLAEGPLRSSTPSLLLPIAMAATIDLAPRVRFRSPGVRAVAILAATLLAAVWFEGVVPMVRVSSIGDWRDAAAMVLGGVVAALLPIFRHR